MSVLVKGMEMPKTCAYCRFIYADPNIEYEQPDGTKMVGGCCCCFTGNVIWNTKRDDDCPLGDVPTPHGRLIDADALIEDLERQCKEVFRIDAVSPDDYWITRNEAYNEALWKSWVESFGEYLKTRPTIIEAEGENGSK